MTKELATLEIRDRKKWRSWLAKNHSSSEGVWLVFHKDHTGVKSIPYEDVGPRGSLLRLDRQPDQAPRRRPLRTQVHAAEADEQVVGSQSQTVGGARGGRTARRIGESRRADRQPLCGQAGHSRSTRILRDGAEGECKCLAVLSKPRPRLPPSFRGVGPHGEAARDAREAHPRIDQTAGSGEEAGIEIAGITSSANRAGARSNACASDRP